MADGARTAGARIVAALMLGPAVVSEIVERSERDEDTVRGWLEALEAAGVAVRRGKAWRPAGTGQIPATVWAINTGER